MFVADYVSGGELFTHLYQREHFIESEVRIYIGEIILALEHLHKVNIHPYLLFAGTYLLIEEGEGGSDIGNGF
uniref:Protein kinase domain-containing protein n=1 Tax=Timema douglasi TaxID=61478 RepID=A0A7R8ZAY8_TIMDO|nr:unnamed protein product [Timema douglasi]